MPDQDAILPAWTARAASGEAAAAFSAGGALALLDRVVRAETPGRGVWLDRLALKSAAAAALALGRNEDEAAIRDAVCLAENHPGPAGRLLLLWRRLAGRGPALDRDAILAAFALVDLPAGRVAPLLDAALAADSGATPVLAAAQVFAAAGPGSRAEIAVAGFWLADLVLARRLNWPVCVPLLSVALPGRSWRAALEPGSAARWFEAARAGAGIALPLAADLDRRAANLLEAAPRLRAKKAPKIVERLLEQDAIPASGAWTGMTERSLRRLFDRLVTLGAVRELTGRPSFRLYGL